MTKQQELVLIVQKNEQQIKAVVSGELEIHRIELDVAKIEVREKRIFLDKHIIEASDQARLTVLDRERQLIKVQFEKLYKKQIQELEANVLAYQDLLMTKELSIKKLEKDCIETTVPDTTALQVELSNLKMVLQEKLTLIEELR